MLAYLNVPSPNPARAFFTSPGERKKRASIAGFR
jgi:hypothetical protein